MTANMNMHRHFQAELETSVSVLQQQLKLEICYIPENTTTLVDLLDDAICKDILQDFAMRIQAKNLKCATSLFIKYWSTLWILPFLYCHAASLPFVKWQSSALVVELPQTWYWDRTLQLTDSTAFAFSVMSLQDIDIMFEQFNVFFQQISKIGRIPYVLLWENAAVRVVQFYQSLAQQNLSEDMHARLVKQQELLKAKSAQSFNLIENPFVRLWNNWHPEFKTYMRKKCCFYFQLEEAGQVLCRNCPLQQKHIKRD